MGSNNSSDMLTTIMRTVCSSVLTGSGPVFLCAVMGAFSYAQFTTIINVPPDPAPASVGANTQLNLFEGGALPARFTAGSSGATSRNIEVNIQGGTVGEKFKARRGSTINISGGIFGGGALMYAGSTVNLSGGTIQRSPNGFRVKGNMTMTGGTVGHFRASSGSIVDIYGGALGFGFGTFDSTVTLFGGDFRLDGGLLPGLERDGDTISLNLPATAQLTGILSDGTPFAFSDADSDYIRDGTLRLTRTPLPPVEPELITASTDPVPLGIRSGQTLVVDAGSFVPDHFNAGSGSTIEIGPGGTVGENFDAAGAVINMTGGVVGSELTLYKDTILTVSGGSIGARAHALGESTVNILGGNMESLKVFAGSNVRIAGGAMGDNIGHGSKPGSSVRVIGSDFRVNGETVLELHDGDILTLPRAYDTTLTGVLRDGTPFAFSAADHGTRPSEWVIEKAPIQPIGPPLITASTDPVPLGIRMGQSLVVDAGGGVPNNFVAAPGSFVDVQPGGVVGTNLEVMGAVVEITGGEVGAYMDVFGGGVASISGGLVGREMQVMDGGRIDVSGGTIGSSLFVEKEGIADISGGAVDGHIFVESGGTLNLSGGTVEDRLTAWPGSEVNIVGTDFNIDGVPIAGLSPGEPFLVTDRPFGYLQGHLADGTPFRFFLGSSQWDSLITRDATLTITEIDALCDLDGDGSCAITDINSLMEEIAAGTNDASLDLTGDGLVDLADRDAWLSRAGKTNGLAHPYLAGDANLDGTVNAQDLDAVGIHWRGPSNNWSDGNFEAVAGVAAGDLNVVGKNWQQSVTLVAVPIPEASTFLLLVIGGLPVAGTRRWLESLNHVS